MTSSTKKILFYSVLILGLIGVISIKFNTDGINKQEQTKAKQVKTNKEEKDIQDINTTIQQMLAHTNAISNWTSALNTTKESEFRKVFTFELEKILIVDSPILFIGDIVDIKIKNDKEYTLIIDLDLLSNDNTILWDMEIQLSLTAPQNTIDSFINKHPEVANYPSSSIAVVAKINSIDSSKKFEKLKEETFETEIKKAYGDMLNIEFLGKYGLYGLFSN